MPSTTEQKDIPLVVRYFDVLSGVKNGLLYFIEQADKTVRALRYLTKPSLDTNKLDILQIMQI
jgi:hypothetical protein